MTTPTGTLTLAQERTLVAALHIILRDAVDGGGISDADTLRRIANRASKALSTLDLDANPDIWQDA